MWISGKQDFFKLVTIKEIVFFMIIAEIMQNDI